MKLFVALVLLSAIIFCARAEEEVKEDLEERTIIRNMRRLTGLVKLARDGIKGGINGISRTVAIDILDDMGTWVDVLSMKMMEVAKSVATIQSGLVSVKESLVAKAEDGNGDGEA